MLDPKVVAIPLYLGLMAITLGLGSLAIGALYGVVQLAVFWRMASPVGVLLFGSPGARRT